MRKLILKVPLEKKRDKCKSNKIEYAVCRMPCYCVGNGFEMPMPDEIFDFV